MYHIGLIGKPDPARLKVKQALDGSSSILISLHSQAEDLLKSMKVEPVDAIVFVIDRFEESHIHFMRILDSQMANSPFVVTAASISHFLRKKVSDLNLKHGTIIDRRYEISDLRYVVHKIIRGEGIHYRAHCRYRVNQAARIQSQRMNPMDAVMTNLSMGGAQLRVGANTFAVGEEIFLDVQPHKKTRHLIPSEVRWVSDRDDSIGVKFNADQIQSLPLITAI